jgi:ATP-binding cassette subfamily B protein
MEIQTSSKRRFSRAWLSNIVTEGRHTLTNMLRALDLLWAAHRGATAAMVALNLIAAVIPAAEAYVGKLIIDSVVAAMSTQFAARDAIRLVLPYLLAEFVLIMGDAAISQVRTLTELILKAHYNHEVSSRIIHKALSLDLSHFENAEYHDRLQNVRREADFRTTRIVNGSFDLLQSIIKLASYAALLVRFSPWIAMILFFTTIPSFLAQSRYSELSFRLLNFRAPEARKQYYYETLLTDSESVKEIKLFGLGEILFQRYTALFAKFLREDQGVGRRRAFVAFAWGLLSTISYYLSYAWIVLQAVAHSITLGDMTLYVSIVRLSQKTFEELFNSVRSLYEQGLFINNLFLLLALETRMTKVAMPKSVPRKLQQGIQFKHVSFQYPGLNTYALRDINLTIHPGEKIALVGANGAGKTTLVKLLTRLYDPTEGQVLLDGVDLREFDFMELRQRFGIIFQDFVRYHLPVSENIGFGQIEALADRSRIICASERSGAHTMIQKLPQGYDTQLGGRFEKGRELSGGEWQKVALARAFVRDSEVLVFDEPSTALDAENYAAVFAKFDDLTQGKTAVLISHSFNTVRMADRIAVIEGGTVSELGTHRELLALGGTYARFFTLQAEGYR